MNDLVSVIVPYFKKRRFFRKTIDSIKKQTYKKLEIIIIYDDTNRSDLNFINFELKKVRSKKIIINKKNLGAGISRNIGISKSRGKFIAFLDADDIWHKDKIKNQIEFMKKQKVNFSYTNYLIINEKMKVIKKVKSPKQVKFKDLLFSCDIGLSSVMLKSDVLKICNFSSLKTKEDYLLWLNLSKKKIKMMGINKVLMRWRKTENSLSSSTFQKINDALSIYNKHLKFNYIKSLYCVFILSLNFLRKRYL
jgi:teichuronic acid biosynthesis glycosyltransferase TuaG